MRFLLSLCLAFATLVGAGNAANASVLWQLNNFKFDDGARATGWFRWDDTTNTVVEWNIVTNPGSLSGNTYTDANGGTFIVTDFDVLVFYTGSRQFRLGLIDMFALDFPSNHLSLFVQNAGLVGPNGFLECDSCVPYRLGQAGAYLAQTVPEPSTVALCLLGTGLLAVARRKS